MLNNCVNSWHKTRKKKGQHWATWADFPHCLVLHWNKRINVFWGKRKWRPVFSTYEQLPHIQSISKTFLSRHNHTHIQTKRKPQKTDSGTLHQQFGIRFLNKMVGQDKLLEEIQPPSSVMVVHVDDLHSHSISSYDYLICIFECFAYATA